MNPELLTLVFIPRGACHLHDDEKTHFRGWLSDEFRSCSIFSNKRATCKWKLFTMAKRPVLWLRNFQRRIGRLKEAVASQKSHNSFNREICLFVVSSEPLMPECCNSDMCSLRSIPMSSPSLKSVRVRLCVWAVRFPVRTWCLGFKAQGIDTLPLTSLFSPFRFVPKACRRPNSNEYVNTR